MKTIIISLIILCCSQLFAGTDLADARYLQVKDTYTLNADGSMVHTHQHQLKLLTYYAVNRRYGETFIEHNPQHQKLTVTLNQTTMADGKVVPAPFNALNPVLPRFARNAPAYNSLREMVVTHTALERQAVIDLHYTLESRTGYLPGLQEDILLQEDAPVAQRQLTIRIPKGQTLHFTLLNSTVEPEITTEGEYQIYSWQFKNLEALVTEPAHRPFADSAVRLLFSSLTEQEMLAVLEKQWQPVEAPFKIPAAGSALNRALEAQKRVVEELDLTPVPFTATAYHFRNPKTVWQSNYGTAIEKAVLLATVLNKAGIRARALLVSECKTAGSLPSFTRAAVCVRPAEGGSYLLAVDNLNARDLRFRYAGHPALAMGPKAMRIILPEAVNSANRAQMAMHLNVSGNGYLGGNFTLTNQGAANPYLCIQRSDRKLNKLAADVQKSAQPTTILQMGPGELQMEASFDSIALKSLENILTLPLPENPYGSNALHLTNLSVTRYGDLQLPFNGFADSASYHISIPETMQLVSNLANVQLSNAAGRVLITFAPEAGGIRVIRSLNLPNMVVPQNQYPQFMELWQLWNTPLYHQVVLKKVK